MRYRLLIKMKAYVNRLSRIFWKYFYIYIMIKKNKPTLKLILLFMAINILISLTILHQQTTMALIFKSYCNSIRYENDLLNVLKAYRSMSTIEESGIGGQWSKYQPSDRGQSKQRQLVTANSGFDYVFSKSSFSEIKYSIRSSRIKSKTISRNKFFEPRFLINNQNACKSRENDRDGRIFMVFLIHSHKNNYLRRKAMRDTWLSLQHLYLDEVLKATKKQWPNNYTANDHREARKKLELAHLFVIGTDEKLDKNSINFIDKEAQSFNDILMIDTHDNYKNLLYKHLAIVNWINVNCENTTYVVKLDDDVYVNLKPLISHLYFKFGLLDDFPPDYKFLYCNVNEMALPIRNNDSKWYVNTDSYPFEWYPNYCEGFAYITNVATMRLMYQQSKLIPRFWIDDVYFTGLLLYGFEDEVKWFDYKTESLKWSVYDFWDLGNSLSAYELYAYLLSIFSIQPIDYYLDNHFVILHLQKDNKEVNYDVFSNMLGRTLDDTTKTQSRENATCLFNVSDCLESNNNTANLFYFHFYKFCLKFFQKNF